MKCLRCQSEAVVKRGKNASGSQRYLCKACGRHFTPQPKLMGYPPDIRRQAVAMYVDGQNFRRIGRNLNVNYQSVANWVNAAGARAAATPIPRPAVSEEATVELDELFTFVGDKKTRSTSSAKWSVRRAV